MKLVLLAVLTCVLDVTAALFVLSFRRDQSTLGVSGLAVATCAGYIALIHAASTTSFTRGPAPCPR